MSIWDKIALSPNCHKFSLLHLDFLKIKSQMQVFTANITVTLVFKYYSFV